ncbi:MAG TPA: histidine ammonia-lyase [Dongiaceae bacterium]|nr:histidine ammonia-lyase [Dongiaceae bacterium]
MAGKDFRLRPGTLTLDDLERLMGDRRRIAIDPAAWGPVEASAAVVARIVAEGRTAYGVNTGFGSLAKTRIPAEAVTELQRRLVLSHAAGTGPLLEDRLVRGIMIAKINGLARGASGVRRSVIEALAALVNNGVHPCIPAKGSVGASGDLAPLAHMTAALMGEGEIRIEGRVVPARAGLARAGLVPLDLAAKEGLALLNGTQVSAVLAAAGLFAANRVFAAALVTGAMSVDAAAGSDAPFDPRIHKLRGQPGQIEVAAALARLMAGSEIRRSHIEGDDRVQDPYSLRCQPQVMGAVLDQLRYAAGVIGREINAVSDNPLVFADTGEIVSGGNFHAEPVALAADAIAVAIAEIGALAERRIALLTDQHMGGLPPFLVADPGLNSGFMIAHVTSAALASENKSLAHPASVDSLPTSANQEDHVSMATYAARRLGEMAENTETIIAIELLSAAQGIDLRAPLKSSAALEGFKAELRKTVAPWDRDRAMAPDIAAAKAVVQAGKLTSIAVI